MANHEKILLPLSGKSCQIFLPLQSIRRLQNVLQPQHNDIGGNGHFTREQVFDDPNNLFFNCVVFISNLQVDAYPKKIRK